MSPEPTSLDRPEDTRDDRPVPGPRPAGTHPGPGSLSPSAPPGSAAGATARPGTGPGAHAAEPEPTAPTGTAALPTRAATAPAGTARAVALPDPAGTRARAEPGARTAADLTSWRPPRHPQRGGVLRVPGPRR